MMLGAMGQAALRILLLIVVIQIGLWLFRIKKARLLLLAWTIVVVASLTMPALQWAMPFHLPALPQFSDAISANPGRSSVDTADHDGQSLAFRAAEPTFRPDFDGQPIALPWRDIDVLRFLDVFYLLVGGILLLRLTVGIVLALRLLAKAEPSGLDETVGTHIRVSRDVAAPVTIFRAILLPADFSDWPLPMRRAVLAHERSHVARWDFAVLLLAQLNRAIFWFNPVSWWQYRQIAALAELTSDDDAVEVTGDCIGYAEVLLEMGQRSGPLLRGLAMARPATLSYRIERILAEDGDFAPVSWVHGMIVTLGVAAFAVLAAIPKHDSGAPSGLMPPPEWRSLDITLPLQLPVIEHPREPTSVPQEHTEAASHPPLQPPHVRSLDDPQIQSSLEVQMEAGTTPPSAIRKRPSAQQSYTTRQPGRTIGTKGVFGTAQEVQPSNSATKHHTLVGQVPLNDQRLEAGEVGSMPSHEWHASPLDDESPLLKMIDRQTCTGSYLPQATLASIDWVNVMQAKFFRKTDGTVWLTLSTGGGDYAVTRPVVVTAEDKVEFTGFRYTRFTIAPRGKNRLIGTTQNPYGTVDLTCERS